MAAGGFRSPRVPADPGPEGHNEKITGGVGAWRDAAVSVVGIKAAITVKAFREHYCVFSAWQAPWPRLGVIACAASPTSATHPVV